MQGFLAQLQRFGIGRLAAIAGAAAGAIAVLVAVLMNVGGEPKALLYANLDLAEAAQITQQLDQQGVKYELKGDGSTIMVDRDKVAATRLALSAQGLPTSGSVGYELFDDQSALGQTEFVQNLNRQRALEGELARDIRSINGVSGVRVRLSMPKRELFQDQAAEPTASIVVTLAGRDLTAEQVRAIRNYVAGAVTGLKPDAVTVMDSKGRMLAAGAEGESGMTGQLVADRKAQVEARIRRQVQDIVEGVVGPGAARVEVTADLDLARVTVQEERFDPDGQVVRSSSNTTSNSSETESAPDGGVTAAANIPEGQQQPGFQPIGSTSGESQEITNYEISKTVRTEVREPGEVERISVAVAVDGVTAPGANGRYTPRSAEEMQRIEQLVRSAVGFNADRGDQVSVVNVRFQRPEAAGAEGGTEAGNPLASFDKNDIMRAVELAILLVVAALIVFFVVRPMLKSAGQGGGAPLMVAGPGGQMVPVTQLATVPVGAGAAAMASGQIAYDPATGGALALPNSEVEQRIDIARIEGQVKASSVKKVSEFVEKHPEESVSILRTWLHES